MDQIKTLLAVADEYMRLGETQQEVTLSYWIFGDSKKLTLLRGNSDITTRRYASAMKWFAAHWPDGHDLPAVLLPFGVDAATPSAPPSDEAAA